jgi:hypothetical protein
MKKIVLYILVLFVMVAVASPFLMFTYWMYGNPDVDFRSSDSNWADSEVRFKGRQFEDIVFLFELYKLDCDAPTAKLVRTTPIRWYNLLAWPSYLRDIKWNVSYREGGPAISGYYEPSCMHGSSHEQDERAEKKASEYIHHLREGGSDANP